MERIFVYGTLRPGEDHPMARWLASRSVVVGPATVEGRLVDLGDYPGFVPGPGRVIGVLVALRDAADLGELDAYEGVPESYVRERRTVQGPEGAVEAWVYRYIGARAGSAVEGGVWRKRGRPPEPS